MKPGTVFKWNNFPFPKFGDRGKPRWFIYLGDTGKTLAPIIAYIQTTTTQINSYQTGGPKVDHEYLLLRAVNTPFEKDCIIDFSIYPYTCDKNLLVNNRDIEMKGDLHEDQIRSIYNKIRKSSFYSRKIILDIHDSLNLIGITGLKKP